jgi:exo-beta-1,3-glucanase (GH17 family)
MTAVAAVLAIACAALVTHQAAAAQIIPGIGYSPLQLSSGSDSPCMDVADVAKDMVILSNLARQLRLYSCSCNNTDTVLSIAHSSGVRVLLGVWVGKSVEKVCAKQY